MALDLGDPDPEAEETRKYLSYTRLGGRERKVVYPLRGGRSAFDRSYLLPILLMMKKEGIERNADRT